MTKVINGVDILKTFQSKGSEAGPSYYVKTELDAYKLAYYYQNASQVIVDTAISLEFPGCFLVIVINPVT